MTNNYSPSFLRWYAIYPVKKGKFEANKRWIKDKLEKREVEIINHVVQSKKYDTDWKFGRIPYASTYLNQHRYEDEISGCYREPETDNCVPVHPIPRVPRKLYTPEAMAIKNEMVTWARKANTPEGRTKIRQLQKQLDDLYDNTQKMGDIINGKGKE